MFGRRSTPPPSDVDLVRFGKLRRLGCVACLLDGKPRSEHCGPPEIHHFLRGNKRIGHHATVPLARWHHQGVSHGTPSAEMLARFGPSFHRHTRAFRLRYGRDEELLATVNRLIGENA